MPIGEFPPYVPGQLSYGLSATHVSGETVSITIGGGGAPVYDEAAADALAQGFVDTLSVDPDYTWVHCVKTVSGLGTEITPTP